MLQRTFALLILLCVMLALTQWEVLKTPGPLSSTLVLGYMLLTSYSLAFLLKRFLLPQLTSYIIVGLILGPYVLSLVTKTTIDDLEFVNSLALAFIAFCAGGELKFRKIREQWKAIGSIILFQTVIILSGASVAVFFLLNFIDGFEGFGFGQRLVISIIFGVICVARSPSSTIAIISETKSKGEYTNIVLSVTVVCDVVVIMLFGIAVSIGQTVLTKNAPIDWLFFFILLFEVVVAFSLGFVLGKGIVYLIETVKIEFPVVMIGLGFLVIKFSHLFTDYMHDIHNIALNLEPLLICMAAGFTVQNFSPHGRKFLNRMDSVSLPIYIIFFTVVGASVNLEVLKTGWLIGVAIVLIRFVLLHVASVISGSLSKLPAIIYKHLSLGFITQAGVSLGLLTEIVRRFPTIGVPVQSLLIAAITINQFFGPISLKVALSKVGEIQQKT